MKFTDIIVLLDRSGSMLPTAEGTRSSFNSFLDEQKQATSDEARLTLLQFSSPTDQRYTYHNHSVKLLDGLTVETYNPTGGSTALRDAMKRLIDERGRDYTALVSENRPDKVVFVVITDGLDNASGVTAGQIKALVEQQTNKYQWTFIYLGAGHDAITTAREYGFNLGQTLEYAPQSIGYSTSTLSSYVTAYRSADIGTYAVNFTDEDRKKAKE